MNNVLGGTKDLIVATRLIFEVIRRDMRYFQARFESVNTAIYFTYPRFLSNERNVFVSLSEILRVVWFLSPFGTDEKSGG